MNFNLKLFSYQIKTAINFLQNQNVKRSPIAQKQKFLRAKGLTEDEIQLACDRSGVFTNDPNSTTINIGHHPQNFVVQPKQTTIGKIREVLSTVALLSGITYAIYLFYKVFKYYLKLYRRLKLNKIFSFLL